MRSTEANEKSRTCFSGSIPNFIFGDLDSVSATISRRMVPKRRERRLTANGNDWLLQDDFLHLLKQGSCFCWHLSILACHHRQGCCVPQALWPTYSKVWLMRGKVFPLRRQQCLCQQTVNGIWEDLQRKNQIAQRLHFEAQGLPQNVALLHRPENNHFPRAIPSWRPVGWCQWQLNCRPLMCQQGIGL